MRRALVIIPLVPFPPVSGSAKRALRLLEAMERAGLTPHLATADPGGESGADALRARGWRVELLREPSPGPAARVSQHLRRRPSPYLRSVEAFLAHQRADPPAFVEAEHTMSAYYVRDHPAPRWALSTHNVDSAMLRDVASTEHGLARLRQLARAAAMAAAERRAAPRADAVLCVSDADAAHFERLGGRAVVVPNGIDDELLDAPVSDPSGSEVLFFGQLSYTPNAVGLRRFLADSWPRLLAQRPEARLRVVGTGAPDDLAAAVRAAPRTRYVGFVEDIRAELERAALVAVPVWQGGGTRLKVLEALAAGRPVVSTALGAAGIGFRDREHGLLADDPRALADAAATVLGDPALAASLAAGGRRLAARFRWSLTTAPAERLYASWT
jgi:glycosyltransferase involved in cell wall biosynthesis